MTGGPTTTSSAAPPAENALVASGLTKSFGGFTAVNAVNLTVRKGAIHALIGPNGAGKTTCFNLLTKALQPTAGSVQFDGEDITGLRMAEVAKRGLVRSFQISAIFPHLTALENVRVALQSRYGQALKFWRSLRAVEPLNVQAERLLEQVGLGASVHVTASDLSYGKKRALEIATTLALEPKMMLLDEPTAGMGHEDIEPITELIRESAKGRTVLIVEHNLSVVSALCDRITVLQHGEVIADGAYAQVSSDPKVVEAYMGGLDDL
jgi:branched-chain amino acid transport system ATP-binding protein